MLFNPSPGEDVENGIKLTNNSTEEYSWKAKSSNASLLGVEPVRGKISPGKTMLANIIRKGQPVGEKQNKVQIVYWKQSKSEQDSQKAIFSISSSHVKVGHDVVVSILELKSPQTTTASMLFSYNKSICHTTPPLRLVEGPNKISHSTIIPNVIHGVRQRLELVLRSQDGSEIGRVKLDLGMVEQNGNVSKGEVKLGSMFCKLEMKAATNNHTPTINPSEIIDYSNTKPVQKQLSPVPSESTFKEEAPTTLLSDLPVNNITQTSDNKKRKQLKGGSNPKAVDDNEPDSSAKGTSKKMKNLSNTTRKRSERTKPDTNNKSATSNDSFRAKPRSGNEPNPPKKASETIILEHNEVTGDDNFDQIESEWILSDNTPDIDNNNNNNNNNNRQSKGIIQPVPVPLVDLQNAITGDPRKVVENETPLKHPKQCISPKQKVLRDENVSAPSQPLNPILKGKDVNMKVFIRVRSGQQPTNWKVSTNETSISHSFDRNKYQVDRVIETSDNVSAFGLTNLTELAGKFVKGFDCTALAYGQTSSGKTYSMFGEHNDGFIPQTVSNILSIISNENSVRKKYQLKASYYEIYNEDVFDLLSNCSTPIPIREVSGGTFAPVGLVVKDVEALTDSLNIISNGNTMRSTGFSNLNERSSRSHTVFELTLHNLTKGSQLVSTFNLVDLAGSESLVSEGGSTQQRKETMGINSSLSFLKRVILSLATNEQHIPYRNSSLTKVLKRSLGGNSLTTLICTINTHEDYKRETRSTLEFGAIAKTVKNPVSSNQTNTQPFSGREKLKKKVEALAGELKSVKEEMQQVIEENRVLKGQNSAENKLLERLEAMQRALVADCQQQQQTATSFHDNLHSVFSKNLKTETLFDEVLSYMEFGCVVHRRGEKVMLYLSEGEVRTCLVSNSSADRRLKIDTLPLQNIEYIQIAPPSSLRFVRKDREVLVYSFTSSADREACLLALSLLRGGSNGNFIRHAAPMPLLSFEVAEKLLPAEQTFCSNYHLSPESYLDVKQRLLLSSEHDFLTLHDIRTQTSIDMFTAFELVRFFCSQKLVSRHEVFYIHRPKITIS